MVQWLNQQFQLKFTPPIYFLILSVDRNFMAKWIALFQAETDEIYCAKQNVIHKGFKTDSSFIPHR